MKIDVWTDIICPFCYIGKRRLEIALDKAGIEADIEFHSFELNERSPKTLNMPLPDVMSSMYGMSKPRALQVLAQEEAQANSVGLEFNWREARPGNTFDAHRLLHLAKEHDLGAEAQERFLRAYFTEGQEIGSNEVLRKLAIEVGLDESEVDEVLAGGRYADAVRADEQKARDLGVRGVPYFVINNNSAVSGAQNEEIFVQILLNEQSRVAAETEAKGNVACEDGFCEVQS